MSNLTVRGNVLGTGTVIVESPNTNSNRTLTLPDATTTLVGTDATQTLTNKTIQGGALTLMTAQASTSGTAFDFTGIPSWAKRITIILDAVSLSATGNILVQIGDSGGIETTGYSSVGVGTTGGAGAAVAATDGFIVRLSAAAVVYSGHMTLTLISGNKWIASHSFGDPAGSISAGVGGGTKTLSDVLTQVRVTRTSTDTFDAGSINVMYEG